MDFKLAIILMSGVLLGSCRSEQSAYGFNDQPAQDLSPKGEYDNIVKHDYYTLCYSEDHKQAEWVMYALQSSTLNPSIGRTDNFRPDPLVTEGNAQLSDYRGSGFDRGHLAPAADMKYTGVSMSESFYMSNISPQTPSFNRHAWRKIEAQFRNWGHEYGKIIIVTGPVLNGDYLGSIGSNRVTVPRYYYKVAIDPNNLQRNIAILIENKSSSESIKNFVVSIDSLEAFTEIDFFHKLENSLEAQLEGTTHENLWNWDETAKK
ncbi:MAG: DNA/RNA non-specific endonuclease [Crocinitomicaceae bacterium]